ncbi:tail protein X [Rhodoplanes sp. TEM]|uniref:Tail protein X n=1 Tax=Rhodoplanes tepidamans TaxID=200616 RepID=A0ABT5JCI1_RHOTP|nr:MULTISPECIES: tail protein X [Rhodoplanes]MDC7787378.1 tail protein X [Rhodoplanes tepidamans]MDC7984740.1 tail protein X [Rhodoplanes sp. TEM]MDQ0358289.1 phage tail protein X [Rhodoplanes tepidamans]
MSEVDRLYTVRRDGLRLDHIARAELGSERNGTVEAILDLNPGLAALGPIVPVGTVIWLPPRPAAGPLRRTVTRIWGDA